MTVLLKVFQNYNGVATYKLETLNKTKNNYPFIERYEEEAVGVLLNEGTKGSGCHSLISNFFSLAVNETFSLIL